LFFDQVSSKFVPFLLWYIRLWLWFRNSHALGLLVALRSLWAVLLNSSSVPYNAGDGDTGHGDQDTVGVSKPDARWLTSEQQELLVVWCSSSWICVTSACA